GNGHAADARRQSKTRRPTHRLAGNHRRSRRSLLEDGGREAVAQRRVGAAHSEPKRIRAPARPARLADPPTTGNSMAPPADARPTSSAVEVQRELVGVRATTDLGDLVVALPADPGVQEIT